MRKSYILAIVLFILSMVFNEPETENGLSLLLFMACLLSAFVGFLNMMQEDEKLYFGDDK